MRPFVLVLSCLLALSTHAQLGTRQVNQEMREAEEARRQQIRMEREQHPIVIT